MSSRGRRKRWKSTTSARRMIADSVSIPRKQRSQPHGLAIGRGGGHGLELLVELGLPRQGLLEREQGGLEGALQRRQVEALLADPPPVSLAPVFAGETGTPVTGEELEHAMPPAEDVAANIVAAADEIAHGLLALVEDVDGGEFPGAKQAHELCGVAPVGLIRWPGRRGVSAGAMTAPATPSAMS